MTLKFLGSKSFVLAVCAGLCGCQNSTPRTQSPAFTQRPPTSQQFANQPGMQQGMGAPMNTTMQNGIPQSGIPQNGIPSSGVTQTGLPPSSMNGVPSQTQPFSGSQSRLTQQPYAPPTGPGASGFGGQPPAVPTLSPTTSAPTFDMPPPMAPPR